MVIVGLRLILDSSQGYVQLVYEPWEETRRSACFRCLKSLPMAHNKLNIALASKEPLIQRVDALVYKIGNYVDPYYHKSNPKKSSCFPPFGFDLAILFWLNAKSSSSSLLPL